MPDQSVIVAIDIGTTKVAVLIGELEAAAANVIGIGTARSDGLRKGVVIDIDRTVQAVSTAVEAAERMSGYKVRSALVGVSGGHISSQSSRGMVAISGRRDIGPDDTQRAMDAAQAVSIPNTREILHVMPRGYIVDGQSGVRDPIGMTAVRLEVEAHIITAASTSVQNLGKCVQRAGVAVDGLVLTALATAEAVLSDADRELGVALVDIGGDTSDVAVFQDGAIAHAATIPLGGRSITSDLGIVLRVAPESAETIKTRYATALPLEVDPDEVVQITSIGEEQPHGITRRHIAEVVESRVQELFDLVAAEIEAAGATNRLQAGIVLTGGGAQLPGIARAARDQLGMAARISGPHGLGGLTDQIADPPYAAASGLLLWGARKWTEEDAGAGARGDRGGSLFSWFARLFRGLVP
ncbi:MAG: cell division protein FtsA [Chloroflexi bacterium]|nr:cell division protein FtsA [Chloroflexota bacterium]